MHSIVMPSASRLAQPALSKCRESNTMKPAIREREASQCGCSLPLFCIRDVQVMPFAKGCRLTTQAQRRRPRDAPIANAPARRRRGARLGRLLISGRACAPHWWPGRPGHRRCEAPNLHSAKPQWKATEMPVARCCWRSRPVSFLPRRHSMLWVQHTLWSSPQAQ